MTIIHNENAFTQILPINNIEDKSESNKDEYEDTDCYMTIAQSKNPFQ